MFEEIVYPFYNDAFSFLASCSQSRFDFTSAESLHPKKTGVMLPRPIIESLRFTDDFDDFVEYHGVSRGEEETLSECVNFFNKFGIRCSTENISLTNHILSSLPTVYGSLKLSQSNKLLIIGPTFGPYFQQLKARDIGFETLITRAEDGFLPSSEELEKALTESGAKVILLCYPNNPTGSVMTEECARNIARIAMERNIFVISDEAFLNNSLSEKRHFPIAAVEGMLDHSFTITSAAKSVFAAGRKNAFCVSSPEMVAIFERLGGYPSKQDQRAMTAAIADTPENREYLENCRQYYLENIEIVKAKIAELNQQFSVQFGEEKTYVKPLIENPDATNVYLLDFSGLRGKGFAGRPMNTGLDAAKWLLKEASIGTVPGECFAFDEREMLVRIALNQPSQELVLAFDSAISAAHKIQNQPNLVLETSSDVIRVEEKSQSNQQGSLASL
jgi:aspartate aminotransferase